MRPCEQHRSDEAIVLGYGQYTCATCAFLALRAELGALTEVAKDVVNDTPPSQRVGYIAQLANLLRQIGHDV